MVVLISGFPVAPALAAAVEQAAECMRSPRVVVRLLADAAAAAAAAAVDDAAAAASGCSALSAQVASSRAWYHTPDVAVMRRNMVLRALPSAFSIGVLPAP